MSSEELLRVLELGSDLEASAVPAEDEAFLRLLAGSCFIRQRGRDSSRLRLVSTLLHGNEPSGLRAVQRWLRSGRQPEVDVLFFFGAVETALGPPLFDRRVRPGGSDMNRCWLPPFANTNAEARIAHEALRLMRESGAESLVDIHNNTGNNPAYGVGPVPGAAELNLVALFGRRFVHSPLRLGTLVEATCEDFPSVTVECGRSGDPAADEIAFEGITRYLEADEHETRRIVVERMSVLTDPIRVCVARNVSLAFGDGPIEDVDFTVALDVDRHNFEQMSAGLPIGWLGDRGVWPVEALDEAQRDRSREFFELRNGHLVTRRPLIPIMMTTNRANALADCLFYVVQQGEEIRGDA